MRCILTGHVTEPSGNSGEEPHRLTQEFCRNIWKKTPQRLSYETQKFTLRPQQQRRNIIASYNVVLTVRFSVGCLELLPLKKQ